VKAVEIGDGMAQASQRGSAAHDAIAVDDAFELGGGYVRRSDHAGGLEGGISSGAPIIVKVAMKPLATLNRPVLETIDVATGESTVSFKERTDVTAVPALGVVSESMVALVLANEALRKFGGDTVEEFGRNFTSYVANLGSTASAARGE
jgi:chorismate synthase